MDTPLRIWNYVKYRYANNLQIAFFNLLSKNTVSKLPGKSELIARDSRLWDDGWEDKKRYQRLATMLGDFYGEQGITAASHISYWWNDLNPDLKPDARPFYTRLSPKRVFDILQEDYMEPLKLRFDYIQRLVRNVENPSRLLQDETMDNPFRVPNLVRNLQNIFTEALRIRRDARRALLAAAAQQRGDFR